MDEEYFEEIIVHYCIESDENAGYSRKQPKTTEKQINKITATMQGRLKTLIDFDINF